MTETIALATGLVALAAAVIGLLAKLAKLSRGVQQVHVLVNSQMQEALARIDQLHAALLAAGVDVPERPDG